MPHHLTAMPHHLTAVPGELLKTTEVAERLNMSVRYVLYWAGRNKIPSILTPGGIRRYPAAGVEQVYREMYGQ